MPIPTSTTDDIVIPIATSEYKFKLISIEGYKVDLFRNIFIKTKDHISGKTKVDIIVTPLVTITAGSIVGLILAIVTLVFSLVNSVLGILIQFGVITL